MILNTGKSLDALFTEYMDAFFSDDEIPGGIVYLKQLKSLKLDFSSSSIDRIDKFLIALRQQVKPERDDFFQNQQKANLMILLAMYLCSYAANSYGASFKLYHYEEPEIREYVPQMPQSYENSIVCILDEVVCTPLAIISSCLFGEGEIFTCRKFVDNTINKFKNKMPRIPRNIHDDEVRAAIKLYHSRKSTSFFKLFKKNKNNDISALEGWNSAMYKAGLAASVGMSLVEGGGRVSPTVLVGNTFMDFSLQSGDPMQNAIKYFDGNAKKHKVLVMSCQAFLPLPIGLRNVIVIEAINTDGEKLNASIRIPFIPASKDRPFNFLKPILVKTNVAEEFWPILFFSFNAGLGSAKGVEWDEHYLDNDSKVFFTQ